MNASCRLKLLAALLSVFFGAALVAEAQVNPNLYSAMRWRNIGPFRGGRVTAVAGVNDDKLVYYMGATGGGVWKTVDAGISWQPISDAYFKTGSVGAIAVFQADPKILYVGMGESALRANISHGDGVYKSTDAGKTWTSIGLRDTRQIGKILIDPANPDVVYVAAIGHPYGPNPERGVFRTRDGGKSWQKVLYLNDKTGAPDLAMDPQEPLTLYATTWQVLRQPWGIDSVGPGGGIYKTTDGGDHWKELKGGLPKGDKGKIGVTVSPVNHNRLWATVEAEDGGIYRSDDAGETWTLLYNQFDVRSRQYYYGKIFADPQQLDTVYTFSAKNFRKSTDGGKTYHTLLTPHGDYHDLWIDPHDDRRMVDGDDGGATVTFDGGKSWSSDMNQPTGQFYTVKTDNNFPYRVLGAQQDDTTVSIASSDLARSDDQSNWYVVGGGESGYVVPDPKNPNLVYAGAFWGLLTRYDHSSGIIRNISIWPDVPGGRTGAELKYRFQWTYPIAISPARAVYAGANVLFKSTDEGQSWQTISPDLTRNDVPHELGRLEDVYSTIFTIAPSPLNEAIVWTGSDDGLIHLTRDGGKTWTDVTPPEIPRWTRINIIEASPTDPATAYVAANRYQLDEFKPMLYRTHDYGKTWQQAVDGIAADTFVRTVRQDPTRPGLLYAGTETGVYVSFDDGDHWQTLQLNLPIVPITDLAWKDHDLVASTQGRAFWILDDVTPLEQVTAEIENKKSHLFKPLPAYRPYPSSRRAEQPTGVGQNPPGGVIIDYYLGRTPSQPVTLEFEDSEGKAIASFSSEGGAKARGAAGVTAHPGSNRFVWNMRYPDAQGIDGQTYLLMGTLRGPMAAPGEYKVKLTVDGDIATQSFTIKTDPRLATSQEDFRRQLALALAIRDQVTVVHQTINAIHRLELDLKAKTEKPGTNDALAASARKFDGELNGVLNKLYQPEFTGYDDQTLIFELQLNNRLASLENIVQTEYAPTDQDFEVFKQLNDELHQLQAKLKQILDTGLAAFNAQLQAQGIPMVTTSLTETASRP